MPPKQQTNRQSNEAFGILPNAVARDVRLGPAALVALTYRMTFADTTAAFGLNSTALRRQRIVRGKGLGRDVIEAALRQARDAGYLQRQQSPRRSGRFGYAVDKLALPPCSLVDQSGWDRQGTDLCARTGRALRMVPQHHQEGRGRTDANRLDRAADGTVVGVRYWLLPSANAHARDPGYGLPGRGHSGRTRTKTSHVFPMGNNQTHTGDHPPPSRQAPPATVTETDCNPDIAFADPALLGWAVDDPHRNS